MQKQYILGIMETSVAPWLDKEFFKEVLQKVESIGTYSTVSVVNIHAQHGLYGNYMSNIVKVKVEYTFMDSEKLLVHHFFTKVPLTNKAINESMLFENEVQMYDEVIPKLYEVAHLEVSPKRYVCSIPDCLVMEDLNEAGYMMCDSIRKLDYKHAKAALVTLAKFHASSVALKQVYPELIERHGVETVYTHNPKFSNRFKPRILMRLYGVARVLQTIEGCEKFGDILIDSGDAFWDLIVEVCKPNSKVNVLNHGDFWTNNLLFKYDSAGIISDVKIVDYQMRRYCSPAYDLLYLFWTSADDVVRMKMYELLEMYRHTFNSFLAELRCPGRMARQELKEEISKCSPLILLISLFLPIIFPDSDQPIDVTQIEASEESMTSLDFDINPILIPFKSKYYRNFLPEMCRELETMKIFQILVKNKKYEIH